MSSLIKTLDLPVPAAFAWDAILDIGALHHRLVADFVQNCWLEGNVRTVCLANGLCVREEILGIDHAQRRLAYAVDGRARYHHAAVQVLPVSDKKCRIFWTTDLAPDHLASAIDPMMAAGLQAMQRTLLAQWAQTCWAMLEVPASQSAVYAALTDPQRLARWWGAEGFGNRFEICDIRPGGDWRFSMVNAHGQSWDEVYQWQALRTDESVRVRHVNAPSFELSILLQPGDWGTRIEWMQRFDDAWTAESLRPVCEIANLQNLQRWSCEVMRLEGEVP